MKENEKFFQSFYRLDLFLINGFTLQISQWDPYDKKTYIKKRYEITHESLERNLNRTAKKDLINGRHVWVNDESMDKICSNFGWPPMSHFIGCKKCNGFRFVPLMSFYTGCPICNDVDHGSYTYFEASSRSEN